MDAIGIALVSAFVLMMIDSVFALRFLAPPAPEQKHQSVQSSVIG